MFVFKIPFRIYFFVSSRTVTSGLQIWLKNLRTYLTLLQLSTQALIFWFTGEFHQFNLLLSVHHAFTFSFVGNSFRHEFCRMIGNENAFLILLINWWKLGFSILETSACSQRTVMSEMSTRSSPQERGIHTQNFWQDLNQALCLSVQNTYWWNRYFSSDLQI